MTENTGDKCTCRRCDCRRETLPDGRPCVSCMNGTHREVNIEKPTASDAGMRALVQEIIDDPDLEGDFATQLDRIESVLNVPAEAVCDVAREPCVHNHFIGDCMIHSRGQMTPEGIAQVWGKFEAAGGDDD